MHGENEIACGNNWNNKITDAVKIKRGHLTLSRPAVSKCFVAYTSMRSELYWSN